MIFETQTDFTLEQNRLGMNLIFSFSCLGDLQEMAPLAEPQFPHL